MMLFLAAQRRSGFRTWLPLLLLCMVCPPARAGESWVGKTILVKKAGIRIGHSDGEESVYTATLRVVSYRVLAEEGNFIKVNENGVADWFSKNDAVLLENAVDYFTDRIRANPRDAAAYVHRGVAWRLKGELDIAVKDYDEAIRLDPKHAPAFIHRGIAYRGKKDYDRAIKDYDEAIRLDPKYVWPFINRGNAYQGKKVYDRAIKDYDEAIRLDPKFAYPYGNRAETRSKIKQYAEAVRDFEIALQLHPSLDGLHRDYALFRATCPEASYRDGEKAVQLAQKALELAGRIVDWEYRAALAAAYAETGQFDKAVTEQTRAVEDKSLDREDRARMEQRLKLYRDKKPYRDQE